MRATLIALVEPCCVDGLTWRWPQGVAPPASRSQAPCSILLQQYAFESTTGSLREHPPPRDALHPPQSPLKSGRAWPLTPWRRLAGSESRHQKPIEPSVAHWGRSLCRRGGQRTGLWRPDLRNQPHLVLRAHPPIARRTRHRCTPGMSARSVHPQAAMRGVADETQLHNHCYLWRVWSRDRPPFPGSAAPSNAGMHQPWLRLPRARRHRNGASCQTDRLRCRSMVEAARAIDAAQRRSAQTLQRFFATRPHGAVVTLSLARRTAVVGIARIAAPLAVRR
mmetsp:Transcript_14604/g.37597  ORF Transcript_14604/g.37597 Transcript_14604/m.37597 type:complete len:279 (-) Transcript_14604:93-929(-)